MKLKLLGVILFGCLGFANYANANEVLLTVNQPMNITFRIAHKNPNNQPVFGELQSIDVSNKVTVPVSLDNYDRAGIVIISVNGHDIRPSHNQFDQAEQCSMTTDKTKSIGALDFVVSQHQHPKPSITCSTHGGVFG